MRKTMMSILLMASSAFASTVVSSLDSVSSDSNSITLNDYTSTSTVLALTLNVETLTNISGGNFDGIGDATKIYDVSGKWTTSNYDGVLGVSSNGSSTSKQTGLYANWTWGSQSASTVGINAYPLFTSTGTSDKEFSWDNVKSASLVFAFSAGSVPEDTTAYSSYGKMQYCHAITLLFNDGTTLTVGGEKNDLFMFSIKDSTNAVIGVDNAFVASGITLNQDIVESATVYSDTLTYKEVQALSVARLVPEPTTATLSLLALAGLAVRRRRK